MREYAWFRLPWYAMGTLEVPRYLGFCGSAVVLGSSNLANSLFQRSGNGSRTGPHLRRSNSVRASMTEVLS
jgi:hypothetical protein